MKHITNVSYFILLVLNYCRYADADTFDEIKIPINDDQDLSKVFMCGFGIQNASLGCPFQDILPCEVDDLSACIEEGTPQDPSTEYESMIDETDGSDKFIKTQIKATGSILGLHASAQLTSIKESTMNSESVSYLISSSKMSKRKYLKNAQNLRLKSEAKSLLTDNPEAFLKQYGPRFMSSVAYGGSFLGYYILNSKITGDTSQTKLVAKVKYNFGFFSVKGSKTFKETYEKYSSDIDVHHDFVAVPDKNIQGITVNEPADIGYMLGNWSVGLDEYDNPLYGNLMHYGISDEILAIISNFTDESIIDQFIPTKVLSSDTIDYASEEPANTETLIKSMDLYQKETPTSFYDYAAFQKLQNETIEYDNMLRTQLDTTQLYALQDQLLGMGTGDISNSFNSWRYYEENLLPQFDLIQLYGYGLKSFFLYQCNRYSGYMNWFEEYSCLSDTTAACVNEAYPSGTYKAMSGFRSYSFEKPNTEKYTVHDKTFWAYSDVSKVPNSLADDNVEVVCILFCMSKDSEVIVNHFGYDGEFNDDDVSQKCMDGTPKNCNNGNSHFQVSEIFYAIKLDE